MRLSVSEAARRLGVSVRTLHYYDEIGLMRPTEVSPAGYRFYDGAALRRLQQILFYRELELPLAQIRAILDAPDYDGKQALKEHRALLELKAKRLAELIRLVDETMEGETMKQPKTTLQDIQDAKERYAQETKARWGDTAAYRESEARHAGYTDAQELAIAAEADAIFAAFATAMDGEPADARAQQLVADWQAHITRYHYPCTKEILACLGEMYVSDPRFTENIDRFGDGTARFMRDAIQIYCA